MTIYGVDWGSGDKTITFDGIEYKNWPGGLPELIEHLNPGDHMHLEPTFCSYETHKRNSIIEQAQTKGLLITTTSTRATARVRQERLIEKSDKNDAKVLWCIATEKTKHLKKVSKIQVKNVLQQNRDLLYSNLIARRNKYKTSFVEEILESLPKANDCPFEFFTKNKIKKKYDLTRVILAASIALEVKRSGGSRKDYERTIGTYESGYPGLCRSNIYHHLYRNTVKNILDKNIRRAKLKEMRKAYRWIFHNVQPMGTYDPEMGTVHPDR